jgi:hypothetical protein
LSAAAAAADHDKAAAAAGLAGWFLARRLSVQTRIRLSSARAARAAQIPRRKTARKAEIVPRLATRLRAAVVAAERCQRAMMSSANPAGLAAAQVGRVRRNRVAPGLAVKAIRAVRTAAAMTDQAVAAVRASKAATDHQPEHLATAATG